MQFDYSVNGLKQFISLVRDKGLASKSTAQGWVVAVNKVLEHVPENEHADVRAVDVQAAIRRFNNKNPGLLSPKSLGEYQRRVAQVITEFLNWAEDPVAYRPKGGGATPVRRRAATDARRSSPMRQERQNIPAAEATSSSPSRSQALSQPLALTLNFPLRPDFLVQITVPRDLKTDEARRLSAFILTLASDYKSTS